METLRLYSGLDHIFREADEVSISDAIVYTEEQLPSGKTEAQVTTPAIPPHSSTDSHSGLSACRPGEANILLLNS